MYGNNWAIKVSHILYCFKNQFGLCIWHIGIKKFVVSTQLTESDHLIGIGQKLGIGRILLIIN